MSRKKARECIMQLLYQMDMNKDYETDNIDIFINNFEQDNVGEYLRNTTNGIVSNLEDVDKLIADNLQGWSINRLAKIDLAILRIAVYEFLFCKDIPHEVSINEAIEISKKYSTSDSYKFINGILGSIYRGLEK